MSEYFDEKTTAQIEAKLHRDILANEDKILKNSIIIMLLLMFIFRGWIGYWLKFGIAIPSKVDNRPISTNADPVQINYTPEESKNKTFVFNSMINNNKITIIPMAKYKLSGLVVAYNNDFVFTNGFFDSAALYDLGAAWGKLGEKNFYNEYFKSYSAKNELYGSRILWTEFKKRAPVDINYAISHWSHSHIVPANRNIMAALLKIRTWDKVEIEGELIDMQFTNKNGYKQEYRTSMSRTDTDLGDRGNGSCETVYVKKVKIGKYIYE